MSKECCQTKLTLFQDHFQAYREGAVEKNLRMGGVTISTSLLALFIEQRSCTTSEVACHIFMLRQALANVWMYLDWTGKLITYTQVRSTPSMTYNFG